MRKVLAGLIVAAVCGTTLLIAQTGISVTFTVSDEHAITGRRIVGRQLGIEPSAVTDAQLRAAIVQVCRNGLATELRNFKAYEDSQIMTVLLDELTEADRELVRAYVLSLRK